MKAPHSIRRLIAILIIIDIQAFDFVMRSAERLITKLNSRFMRPALSPFYNSEIELSAKFLPRQGDRCRSLRGRVSHYC